jgi:hypothetical protein
MYEQATQDFTALIIFFGVSSGKAKTVDPGEFFRTLREFGAIISKKDAPPLRKGPSFPVISAKNMNEP